MTALSAIENHVSDYLAHLQVEKGCSPLTLRNYRHYLNRFLSWFSAQTDNPTIEAINLEMVREYRLHLAKLADRRGATLARKTQGYHAIALRSFLKWLAKNDFKVMAPEKIDLPKISERQVKFLSGEQVDRLLSAPSLSNITGKRDKAILEILFSTGLRVSEVVKLNKTELNLERREFGIVGKGGRARVVFLSARAADWIKGYLAARKDHYTPLFIRHHGKTDVSVEDPKMRLTARSIQRLVKKYARKVKLPVDVTPHVLRHSFASDLLIAGADIRSVQDMLGHKNIATTQIYTHVTNKHLRDIHESFHGRGR